MQAILTHPRVDHVIHHGRQTIPGGGREPTVGPADGAVNPGDTGRGNGRLPAPATLYKRLSCGAVLRTKGTRPLFRVNQ